MGENALKEPTVKECGRFRYIEPNDVLENNRYGKSGTDESFNITSPYEDYCIDVELEVKIPNRGVWVADLSGNSKVGVTSNEGKTVSFFSGDNSGFLSDTPASLIYKDLLSGKQDRESLGITNIHVTYNSYFVPEVTIKFTDIRGMGLMMPHEEVYRQEHTLKKDTPKIEKFFAALFTFPYPEFLLRIKGFYGKKVEYSLVVSDFKSSFNNQTGNFEATVKFIGKMYGMYTDIPMAYLLVAPYCTYGSINNKTIWEQHDFKFPGTTTPIPKLLDLKQQFQQAKETTEQSALQNADTEIIRNINQSTALTHLSNAYNSFYTYVTNSIITSKDKLIIVDNNVFLFYIQDGDDYCSYLYPEENNRLLQLTNELWDSINSQNGGTTTVFEGEVIPNITGLPARSILIGKDENYIITVKKDSSNGIAIEWPNNEDIKFDIESLPHIKDVLSNNEVLPKDGEIKFYVVNAMTFNKILLETIKSVNEKKHRLQEEFNKNVTADVTKNLGYTPTIKNMFIILMAHLQTFMEIFNECILNINYETNRTIALKNLLLNNLPDIPSGISSDSHIPPFPSFKKTNEDVYCYPTDINMKAPIYEDELIKSMFIGCTSIVEKTNKTPEYNEWGTETKKFIPTCITDYNCFINQGYYPVNNPYYTTFNVQDGTCGADWLWFYFAMRCIQKFIMERGSDITAKEFGIYEAYNFWLAHPQPHENIISAFTKGGYYTKFDKFINFLTNPDEAHCYQDKNFSNLLNKDNDKGVLYTFYENTPARIGHNGGDYKQFIEDTKKDIYAFRRGDDNNMRINAKDNLTPFVGYKPYGLMKEIPLENLKDWDTSIKGYSMPDTSNNKHQNIIEKQYKGYSGYYYNRNRDKIKDSHLTWNIMYEEGIKNQFFQFIKNPMGEVYKENLHTIDEHLSQGKTNSHLHNMNLTSVDDKNNMHQRPLFLVAPDQLTTMDFLCAIPHNLERIATDLLKGKKIINIPYATKLFIGYIIHNFQEIKQLSELEDFIKSIVKKCCQNDYSISSLNFVFHPGSFGSIDTEACFAQLLLIIAGCLTTDKDDNLLCPYIDPKNNVVFPVSGLSSTYRPDLDSMIGDIWCLKMNENFFQKDILGFAAEYRRWENDESQGGFKWFAKTMCLQYASEVKVSEEITFTYDTNSSQFKQLKNFLQIKKVQEELESLNTKHKGNITAATLSDGNLLKKFFTPKQGSFVPFDNVYNAIFCQGEADDIEKIYLRFNGNYIGVQELERFLNKISYFIMPYALATEVIGTRSFVMKEDILKEAFNSFIETFGKLYETTKNENDINEVNENNVSHLITTERKLSMYRTLKNLYDKHLTNINTDIHKFRMESEGSKIIEMDRFHFIDTYYNDIGDSLYVNPQTIISIIDDITHGYQTGGGEGILSSEMSLYSFMGLLCQRHNMLLMPMPIFNGDYSHFKDENLEKMFTPIPQSEAKGQNILSNPSYICFYPHQTSQHLDIPISQYKDDGFLINNNDINNTSNFETPSAISELRQNGKYVIPAFGVEYGSQKQSIFKNINVNMDNPQTTEVAVSTMFSIANNRNEDVKGLIFEGQDLYQIYSNYSYTCQVEMMGCAQIQPLMCFQLNNIPMFRGAYQIIHVEHDIVPGNMTTTFKGVRINKNIMPMVSNFITIKLNDVINEKDALTMLPPYVKTDFDYKPMDASKVHEHNMKDHIFSDVSAEKLLSDETLKKHIMFPDNTSEFRNLNSYVKEAFNNLCPTLRQLIYCIVSDLPHMSELLGYPIGIYICSASRYTSAGTNSYHRNPAAGNTAFIRSAIVGTKLNPDGTEMQGPYKDYTEMACAIDINGIVMATTPSPDGKYRGSIPAGHGRGSSLQLFNHIIDYYYDYIRELIWEINKSEKYETKPSENKIDILHLASVGSISELRNQGWQYPEKDQYRKLINTVGRVWMARVTNTTTKLSADEAKQCTEFMNARDRVKAKGAPIILSNFEENNGL